MKPLPRWLAPVLRVSVAVALIVVILRVSGVEDVTEQLRETSPLWLLISVILLSCQILASALRWRLTAIALGLTVSRGAAIREYYLSSLGNTLLPGGVLGDMGRIVRFRQQAGLARAAETVVIERLAGQVALFSVLGAGASLWFWPEPSAILLGVALPLTLAGLAALIRHGGARNWRGFAAVNRAWMRPGFRAKQAALSAVIVALNLGGYWAAAQAVGVSLGFSAAIFALPLALVAMLVPVTVNGWGLREGTAAALWPLVGVTQTGAVAASIAFGFAILLSALPGFFGLVRRRGV